MANFYSPNHLWHRQWGNRHFSFWLSTNANKNRYIEQGSQAFSWNCGPNAYSDYAQEHNYIHRVRSINCKNYATIIFISVPCQIWYFLPCTGVVHIDQIQWEGSTTHQSQVQASLSGIQPRLWCLVQQRPENDQGSLWEVCAQPRWHGRAKTVLPLIPGSCS